MPPAKNPPAHQRRFMWTGFLFLFTIGLLLSFRTNSPATTAPRISGPGFAWDGQRTAFHVRECTNRPCGDFETVEVPLQ